MRNWDIDECIIFEMWDDQDDPVLAQQEKNFQKMLVNNMESVFQIFFRGMRVQRVKMNSKNDDTKKKSGYQERLCDLEKKGIVATRVRPDTGIKQFHAGQIFDHLKKNIKLR